MKKIAIIPARSGSKGLPNKNVLLANGKPLIAYTIEAALESQCFDDIIVSTDSAEYIAALQHYPISFIQRDAALASDTASSFVVIEDVLKRCQNKDLDYFVLLQPTSPLRTAEHLQTALRQFEQNFERFDFLVSVCQSDKPLDLIQPAAADGSLANFTQDYANYRRQNSLPAISPNGAIFAAKPDAYLQQKHFFGSRTLAFEMDKTSSLDIDTRENFEYFYFVLQQKNAAANLAKLLHERIAAKQETFKQTAPINLIGHSILANWQIAELAGQKVANYAIAGINSSQYLQWILQEDKIAALGETLIVMHGTNDIVFSEWTNDSVCRSIQQNIDFLRSQKPDARIYFVEITPTALRVDRQNRDIQALNAHLKQHLQYVEWIDAYQAFCDEFGKLNLAYTEDGLHLNERGYQVLENLIIQKLNK